MGRPDIVTKFTAVRLVVVCLTLYPFTVWWGLVGPGASLLSSGLVVGIVELWMAARLIRLPVRAVVSAVAYPVAHSALMALVVLATEQALDGRAHNFRELFQLVTVGVASYLAFAAASARWMGYDGIQDLLTAWNGWLAKRPAERPDLAAP
jgi:PST family polysaccharide transporter/lipopolysaccharide exporter